MSAGDKEATVLKPFTIFLVFLLCSFAAAAQEGQITPKAATPNSSAIPADAVHQVNPVKPTAESIAQGKKYYGYDCAMCHGNNGDGKGDVAIDEKLKMDDFTNPATLQGKTDGELFYILRNGHDHMPAEPIRLKSDELWNLINYIRTFSAKK
jgi:mono/diheme cytochrome c family protein